MKGLNQLLTLCCSILLVSQSQAQWEWQNAKLSGEVFNAVEFVSPTEGWVVGNTGTILHTTDAGGTWAFQDAHTCADLQHVQFVSASEGWITGEGNELLHTTDHGATWQSQTMNTTSALGELSFINPNEGWILLQGGLLHTNDGGTTWTQINSSINGAAMAFSSALSGWVTGYFGDLFHTTDGGVTWTPQVTGVHENLLSIAAVNDNEVWIAGVPGVIHTSNGGATWASQTGGCCKFYKSISFINNQVGWTIGNGSLRKTTDGGQTWSLESIYENLMAVKVFDANNGFIVGNAAILKSTDGGNTLTNTITRVTSNHLYEASFVNSSVAWTVGLNGAILHTNNGGVTWTAQNSGVSFTLTSVCAISANEAWIAGESIDTLLHTTDAGATWTVQHVGVPLAMSELFFINANKGWATGVSGNIMHTEDGGATWTTQYSNNQNYFLTLFFTDANNGWAAGTNTIMHTTDGGLNWTPQTTNGTGGITCLDFTSNTEGWAAGSDTVLHHTIDGGATWTTVPRQSTIMFPVNAIHFIDANRGWLAPQYEPVSYTLDGGQTWTELTCFPNRSFNDMYFTNTGEAWLLGEYGTILHTNNAPTGTELVNASNQAHTQVSIYPNPFETTCTFVAQTPLVNASLGIYDVLGKQVQQIDNINTQQFDINRENMAAGLYFYTLTQNQSVIAQGKMVVE